MDNEKTLPGLSIRPLGEPSEEIDLPDGVPAALRVLEGTGKGDTWAIHGAFRIGRGDTNELAIADRNVSTLHAIIEPAGPGRFRIRDLESRNGTFVNGERVTDRVLEDGDVVVLGSVVLKYRTDGAFTEPQTASIDSNTSERPPAGGRRKRTRPVPER
ncbi:MAG: FHA domain-containing protein [Deltaproteobacteria bacterium]|nr:FHA domain-containing protein [Deltaproteobacteria bacterium]